MNSTDYPRAYDVTYLVYGRVVEISRNRKINSSLFRDTKKSNKDWKGENSPLN